MTVVIVSWILVLLAVFGLNYAHDVIGESRVIQLETERHQLRAWARSGIELAKTTLENSQSIRCASLGYSGYDNPFDLPLECGQGHFAVGESWIFNGQEQWIPGIRDEGGRLPVALLDSTTLARLPGMTKHGARVILNTKESIENSPFPPFEMLADLDQSSLESAKQYISRYGDAVNINSASVEVLVAVGLPKRAAIKLTDWRSGSDNISGTTDDQLFASLESNNKQIRACALNSEEAAVLAFLFGKKRLTVEPRYFYLVSRGWGEGHEGICEIQVILERPQNGPAIVVEWAETWLN